MSFPLFNLAGVSHDFDGGTTALDGLDLIIEGGGCLGLLGCNGAGKSTLLHILGGLITPRRGAVEWVGQEISAKKLAADTPLRSRFRRQVGIVFQDPDAQWLCDTVAEEVYYGPLQIWSREKALDRAAQVMVMMGINHLMEQPPYTLSGGQKRRAALAGVIAMDPDVLLLDEPTASLDAATTDFLLDWLQEFISRPEKTVIIATHDLELVRELTDRCLVLTPCHKQARFGPTAEILGDGDLLRQMNLLSRRKSGSLII